MTARRPPGRRQDEPTEIAPPNSLEMEQSAIGAMLMLDMEAVTRGMVGLHPRHFYRAIHRDIFQAIRRIMGKRRHNSEAERTIQAIDVVGVHEELRAMGKLAADTYEYMLACIDTCPSAVNIDYYIGVVVAKSKARHFLALGQRLTAESNAPDADPAHLHNATQNALNAINTHGWCDLAAIFAREK